MTRDCAETRSTMGDLAHVVVRRRRDSCVATISGEIDMSNAEEIRTVLEDRLVEDAPMYVIDLTATRVPRQRRSPHAVHHRRTAARTRPKAALVVPEGASVRRLLAIVELPSRVTMHTRVDEAFAGGE